MVAPLLASVHGFNKEGFKRMRTKVTLRSLFCPMIVFIHMEVFSGELSNFFLPYAFIFSQNLPLSLKMLMGFRMAALCWTRIGAKSWLLDETSKKTKSSSVKSSYIENMSRFYQLVVMEWLMWCQWILTSLFLILFQCGCTHVPIVWMLILQHTPAGIQSSALDGCSMRISVNQCHCCCSITSYKKQYQFNSFQQQCQNQKQLQFQVAWAQNKAFHSCQVGHSYQRHVSLSS